MLRNLFLLVPFLLLVHVTSAVALPPCQGDDESKWQNCEGILTSSSGKKYVGVFKDGIFDGENAEHGNKYVGELSVVI